MDLFDFPRVIPDSPKLLNLRHVGVKYAMDKNMDWHSRLPITNHTNMIRNAHKIFYGAEYQDHCFAVAMWTDPVAGNRMSKDYIWLELRRLAISPDAPKFTATWIIAKMVKDIKKQFPDVTRLVSYQDTEAHFGTIYKASGWNLASAPVSIDWNTSTRKRNVAQSSAPKVRWEYNLT